jgi:uncharacterized protein YjdB
MRHLRKVLTSALSFLLALNAACVERGDPVGVAPPTTQAVASVVITPPVVNMLVGTRLRLQAETKDKDGNALRDRRISYTSSDTTVVSISSLGVVTAQKVGEAEVTAISEHKEQTVTIAVSGIPVGSVKLSPATLQLAIGATTQLSVALTDRAGHDISERRLTWTSSDAKVATVTDDGSVTGVAPGTATITAAADGRTGTATVTVTGEAIASLSVTPGNASLSLGQSAQFVATATSASGKALGGRTISWASLNPAIATVSESGVVTANGTGNTVVSASAEGKSATATVNVTTQQAAAAGQVASVNVIPTTVSLVMGQSSQLAALARDAHGTAVASTVTWASSNAGIATVSSTGQVIGVAPGAATIVASSGGKTGSSSVTVTAAPVARVVLSPSSASLSVGQTLQFSATPQSANGSTLNGRIVSWSSSNPTVASVSTSGLVTAKVGGQAQISATSEGQTGNASVTVAGGSVPTPPPPSEPVPSASAPSAPIISASEVAAGTVQLTWQPQGSGADGYRIYRKYEKDGYIDPQYIHVMTGAKGSTGWLDEFLTPGATYHYMVKAYTGSTESAASNLAKITLSVSTAAPPPPTSPTTPTEPAPPPPTEQPVAPTAPGAPTNASAVEVAPTSVALSWQPNGTSQDGFHVYRKYELAGYVDPNWVRVTTVSKSSSSWRDENLGAGATYHYRVTAYAGTAESSASNTASITLSAPPPPPPEEEPAPPPPPPPEEEAPPPVEEPAPAPAAPSGGMLLDYNAGFDNGCATRGPRPTIVNNQSGEPISPASAIEFRYPAGSSSYEAGPGVCEIPIPGTPRGVTVVFTFKVTAPYNAGPDGEEKLALIQPTSGGNHYIEITTPGGGERSSNFGISSFVMRQNGAQDRISAQRQVSLAPDQWHTAEFTIVGASSPGARDGQIHIKVDGITVISRTGEDIVAAGQNHFGLYPQFGDEGNPAYRRSTDHSVFYGHVRFLRY